MSGLTYGSVCSGIEAASVAWHPLGWRAAFLSEIEPFPRAVLAHHYPSTPCHGNFTTIKAGEYDPIDLLVGGTPCQSFSVAGLRGGMADERGNLALEYLRLADRLRPDWLLWENVPGILSSNGGRDFGSFLGGLGKLGYGFAYRSLDAQFAGLAQRRERVFVVGYFGDWRRAAAVLFEPASLRGHSAPCREAGQKPAKCLANGSESVGGQRYDSETGDFVVAHALRAEGLDASEDGTGRGTPLVPVNFQASQSGVRLNETMGTLDANYGARRHNGILASSAVRRLTPRECARLQGFPDDYLDIQFRSKPAADGNKYRALGNSFAVPVVRWIGKRITSEQARIAAGVVPMEQAA